MTQLWLLGACSTSTSAIAFAAVAALLSICYLYLAQRARPRRDGYVRRVLVTGAASGLGRRVCVECAAAGDQVVALDLDAAGLRALEAEVPGILVCVADVTDPGSLAGAVEIVSADLALLDEHGAYIDTICNFAGVIRGGPLVEMREEDMQLVMNVNVLGTFNVNKAFFPLLHRRPRQGQRPRPSPTIINVASEVSKSGLSAGFTAPYSMSKFAIEAMSVALRQELALLHDPVAVVVLNPGAMETPMLRNQQTGGANAFFEMHKKHYRRPRRACENSKNGKNGKGL